MKIKYEFEIEQHGTESNYLLLVDCELGHHIIFYENYEDAKESQKDWYEFFAGYPCNGSAIIFKKGEKEND